MGANEWPETVPGRPRANSLLEPASSAFAKPVSVSWCSLIPNLAHRELKEIARVNQFDVGTW